MLDFPISTYVNKRVPKKKLYENANVSPAIKSLFVEQVSSIIWRNKLSSATLNIEQGHSVIEIEVFEILLKDKVLKEDVLNLIDREIPYSILFLLSHEREVQAWISYKEQSTKVDGACRIIATYHTPWMKEDMLDIRIEGLNTDTIYEHFIRQIAGDSLAMKRLDETLQANIERQIQCDKLKVEIVRLEKQARSERQPKKKFELVQQIREKQKELECRL